MNCTELKTGHEPSPQDEFYPALNRDNVHLVQETILRVDSDALISNTNNPIVPKEEQDPNAPEVRREFDIIIYATGFDYENAPIPTIGRDGVSMVANIMKKGEFMMYGEYTILCATVRELV